eukprot:CAMPEP_0178468748 /NCGR_PEP_ID=MMETSP0689_2-20121128/53076_1 /TAXON_ID=160604 /ORGANISM="Amphidinium massartii, Strain CS-259" /LENGTH=325 /DNA_ID=CAMNT_0020095807 /DNA_START=55 /DNA_END=1032 /DNA_ORIENTATION=-
MVQRQNLVVCVAACAYGDELLCNPHYRSDVVLLRQFHKSSSVFDWRSPLPDNPEQLHGDMVIFHFAAPEVLKYFTYSAVAVACFELIQLVYYTVVVAEDILVFFWNKDNPHAAFYAWDACVRLFQEDIQQMATFSALKALRHVHPSLIADGLSDWMREFPGERSWRRHGLAFGTFILTRIAYLIFGIGALAVKTASVGLHLTHPEGHPVAALLLILAFTNQVMGIIVLDVVLQKRIFLFIFGGMDAEFEDDERSLKHAYLAALMRQIAKDVSNNFQGSRMDFFQALIMVATFDHYDLQKLVLDEDASKKERVVQTNTSPRSPRRD